MEFRLKIVEKRKRQYCSVSTDDYVERLKKLRSHNIGPSRLGQDIYTLKKMVFSSASVLKRW
ncbi:MAG: hypothetical protein ABIJ27_04230 [Candidatus Omnitrophota bacterium]